ncbi:MAG: translation initiation factor IF-2 [Actinobacteria bacterium]|nr:translation initiation factor IF-2 [Actinomycetota bacterium]
MRVYELAKELGIDSKEIMTQAEDLSIDIKTASSGLSDEEADLLRLAFTPEQEEPAEPEMPEPEEAEPAPSPPETGPEVRIASLRAGVTVADFAEAIDQPVGEVVKALLNRGAPAGAGQPMPAALIDGIAEGFGYIVEIETPPPAAPERRRFDDSEADLEPRPPVVTVMGHVDHGKTSLLDTIRKTNVVEGEQGGITQHIGAYQVEVNGRRITFIDTPGHAAFTALRARGANITDIVVLVVAANDGVMPQTVEAISHARAAGVKMIVAINKMDLPAADPGRVRTELTNHEVITEALGGDVPSVELSAVTGQGVDDLLEVIDLIAQLEDFRANPNAPASGVVVEAQLERGRGPVASVIVQRGTLQQGDAFVAGHVSGRARALVDDKGGTLLSAGPSVPVQIMGWDEVPSAGDFFDVAESDREARRVAAERQETLRAEAHLAPSALDRLQGLLEQLRSEDAMLNVIVKADAQGSLEALHDSISKIEREGGRIQIIHTGVGGINENDVTLAEVTESVIVGFNVRPEPKARKAAEDAGVEVRTYGVIYELLDEIEQLLVGQLAPDQMEQVLGTAEVRAIFRVPRVGAIAGCYVTEGVVQRGAKARLLRDGVVVHDGVIGSLRRFKDDVREVASGFECGIGFEGYHDLKEGDLIEVYVVREVART